MDLLQIAPLGRLGLDPSRLLTSELGSKQVRPERSVAMTIHHVATRPRSVMVDNKPAPFRWDAARKLLTFTLPAERRAVHKMVVNMALAAPARRG